VRPDELDRRPRVRRYLFGDEAGNLRFNNKGSTYFILSTVTLADCSLGDHLLELRRQLAWEGVHTHPEFHASEEIQAVRDRVYATLDPLDFRVDATIFEKRKVVPRNRMSEAYFYQFAWFYHLKYLCQYRLNQRDLELLVIPAAIGGRGKRQEAFAAAVRSVVNQVAEVRQARTASWMARTDPCLWAADYCCWAIQRKWEYTYQGMPDTRSYDLIRTKLATEYEIFRNGKVTYY
jgi:Protein of unknown function (DUF3800)